jgi:hypothetical protein
MSRHLSDEEIVELLKAADSVPEPSPLFWEHAARRVRTAIDREPSRPSVWLRGLLLTGGSLVAAALAALLAMQPRPSRVPPDAAAPSRATSLADMAEPDEDSWTFVASLGGDLDIDAAARAGLLLPGETSDRAVLVLDDDERAELATLLHGALAGSEI